MPITNRPDPEYVPEEFETFSDGKYPTIGIRWFSVDDQKAPIFMSGKGRQPLVAMYRTLLEDDRDGPPGSVSPAEVVMLVKAYGGDPKNLPDREEDPTAFLMAARDTINSSDKVVTIAVKDGWVSNTPGLNLPPDKYFTFGYAGISTKTDDIPAPREGQYGKWFGVNLRVVGDLQQRPTPYDGYEQFVFVSYGLVVEEGTPTYETRSKEGSSQKSWTSAAVQTSRLIAAFAPTVEQVEFQDPHNILPELEVEAKRLQRRAVGQVVSNKGRVRVSVTSLAPIDPDPLPMPSSRDVEDEVPEHEVGDVMGQIYALIEALCPGKTYDKNGKLIGKAFDKDGVLTSNGKAWCKEVLKPYLKGKSYPSRFTSWTTTMQEDILGFLKSLTEEEDEF